jgi:hypothetical protein
MHEKFSDNFGIGNTFGSVTAMEQPNIPHFDIKKAESDWLADFKLFNISPIFNEHISNLSPVGSVFVNNVIRLNLKKCKETAVEQSFQSQSTEEAKKCMELLSVVAGWPRFGGEGSLTEQIVSMYDSGNVTRAKIEYKEFVADVLYMGFYSTFRKIDGTPVDKFDVHKAEFFRLVSNNMYKSIGQKTFENRLGLTGHLVFYSTSPEYLPYDVWDNWSKE